MMPLVLALLGGLLFVAIGVILFIELRRNIESE